MDKITEKIQDYMDSAKSKIADSSGDKVCITKKEDIYDQVRFLMKQIDHNTLNIEILKKKVNKMYADYEDSQENTKERNRIAEQTKEAFSQNLSNNASLLSGMSSFETSDSIDKHYNTPMTEKDFNTFLETEPPPTTDGIMRANKDNSVELEKVVENPPPDKTQSLKKDYLKTSLVKCKCNQKTTSGKPLGKVLIELADKQGFGSIKTQLETCGKDEGCKNRLKQQGHKKAIKYLNTLAQIFDCRVSNKKGLFPYNVKEFDSN